MKVLKRFLRKRLWLTFTILALLVIAGGGGAYYYIWQAQQTASTAKKAAAYQTDVVRRGNVELSATGTGALIATTSMDLSFPVSGTLAKVNVQPGDQVSSGDVLAALQEIDQLKLAVSSKELDLQQAQTDLNNLLQDTEKNLGTALKNVSSAQATQVWDQNHVVQKSTSRCDTSTIEKYFYDYIYASKDVNNWDLLAAQGKVGQSFAQSQKRPITVKMNAAYNNWQYCQGYTQAEIELSKASASLSDAQFKQAQANYQKIKDANGIDPDAVALAKTKVKNAELQLQIAKENLAGATMTAPIDGTVISVAGKPGDIVRTSAFITLSDLKHPAIQFYIDQSDMENFKLGCAANVTFDAISGQTFSGVVTEVYPTVGTNGDGASALQGLVELKEDVSSIKTIMPIGLTAGVDVICQQSNNVLIVPVQAVRTDGTTTFVYVLNSQLKPEKREVTVGLKNTTFAEIRSGLSLGETIITQSVVTQ